MQYHILSQQERLPYLLPFSDICNRNVPFELAKIKNKYANLKAKATSCLLAVEIFALPATVYKIFTVEVFKALTS